LPGVTELVIISVPLISLLLFRYHRIYLKFEESMLIRIFTLVSSAMISIIIAISSLSLTGLASIKFTSLVLFGWGTLLITSVVYYSYLMAKAPAKKLKIGYLFYILFAVFYIGALWLTYTLRTSFSTNDLLTSFIAIIAISITCFLPILKRFKMPQKHFANSMVIGAIFVYTLAIITNLKTI